MMKRITSNKGITLIEIVLAIVIAGILGAVALRSTMTITETGRSEITKSELRDIGYAIVGNPTLENNGVRTDFGYVGDVGSMPPSLSALMTNPGYATWDGPYVKNRFDQTADDYAKDAWGVNYSYSSVNLSSAGSGSTIVHKIGNAPSDFLLNRVSGNIYDADGTPPGAANNSSVSILLTVPNGSGGYTTKGETPDIGGFFRFDSIPIGNHDLQLIYTPTTDTLKRFVSVTPKATLYNEYYFPSDYWFADTSGGGSGGISYVSGSVSTFGSGSNCNNLRFDINNSSGSAISLTSITLSWASPTAYFEEVTIDGSQVFYTTNPQVGSGVTVTFSSSTINNGETQTIRIEDFEASITGGPNVDVNNSDFTVTFSDGSVITFNSGACL